MKYYIGLDIGGTKCAVTVGTADQNSIQILEKYKFNTVPDNPDKILAIFTGKIKEYEKQYAISGIGISCGGPLDIEKGVVLSPPNLPGWDKIPVKDYFQNTFFCPVYLQNDANACAVAEWKYGAGKGCQNMIFMTFGTGLGAGLILNGHLYSGTNGMAGELGHWRIADDGPMGYGKSGSFEGFCSGSGIASAAKQAALSGKCQELLRQAGSVEAITAKLVSDLAKAGDRDCLEIYAQSGRMLGRGLSLLIDLLNPQVIVIGSIFTRSRNLLWEQIKNVVDRETLPQNNSSCEIRTAALGEQIGDYAAIAVATGAF